MFGMDAKAQTNEIEAFKTRLRALKKRRRYVYRSETPALARDLEMLLAELRHDVSDPKSGLDAMVSFFKSDKVLLNGCDDSDGCVGDVFRGDAVELFLFYAKQYENKKWLADSILKLYLDDSYGVRYYLWAHVSECVPEPFLQKMVDRFWALAQELDPSGIEVLLFQVALQSLAEQLNDPALLERICIHFSKEEEPGTAAILDIAELHLKCGNAAEALEWIGRIPLSEDFMAEKRDALLVKINEALGNHDAVLETAWRIFRAHRSVENFEQLISAVGIESKSAIIESESEMIVGTQKLSYVDVAFLVELGRIDDAETYMLQHEQQFNGGYDYDKLLFFAKFFQKNGRFLVTSVIYRALLESILGRANSKLYHYGIRYLKQLDSLAEKVRDWKSFQNHESYKIEIRAANKLKYSFWSAYNG